MTCLVLFRIASVHDPAHHYFQYPVPAFITQIFNDVVNTFFYFTLQHGFPVLCYQYHMVLQQKTAVAVCIIKLVFFTLIHEIFLTIHLFLCYNYTTETKDFKEVHPYVFSITDHDKRTASFI